MAKKKHWWSTTLPGQYQQMINFRDKIEGYKDALGLTNQQVLDWTALATAFIEAYEFQQSTETSSQAATEWREEVFYGTPRGDAVSPAPVFAVMGPVTFTRGVVPQFFQVRDHILTLNGYTPAIGEDLGLLGQEEQAPNLGEFQPTIKVTPAQNGYLYSVVVSNRGESDQWEVEYRTKGGNWTSAGLFTGKSVDIIFAPANPGDPVGLEVRVQLKKNNANYGLLSDTVAFTVNP